MTRRLLGGDWGPGGPCTSRKDILRVGCRWSPARRSLCLPSSVPRKRPEWGVVTFRCQKHIPADLPRVSK